MRQIPTPPENVHLIINPKTIVMGWDSGLKRHIKGSKQVGRFRRGPLRFSDGVVEGSVICYVAATSSSD